MFFYLFSEFHLFTSWYTHTNQKVIFSLSKDIDIKVFSVSKVFYIPGRRYSKFFVLTFRIHNPYKNANILSTTNTVTQAAAATTTSPFSRIPRITATTNPAIALITLSVL